MDAGSLLRGLLAGFSIAAPVGPIGILCIRRTLASGRAAGFVSGLGAATADAVYGSIAGFGLTAISNFLTGQQFLLRLAGGVFLCHLGVKTLFSRPASEPATSKKSGLAADYTSAFVLTLTNPATLLSFAAVFAGLGLGDSHGEFPEATLLVAGVFLGSALWWLLLSGGVGLVREKFDAQKMRWVNRLSGLILLSFGGLALWNRHK